MAALIRRSKRQQSNVPSAIVVPIQTSHSTQTQALVDSPHHNDVLMGRGGKNNLHSGNERLREFARRRCEDYRRATKKIKSDISRELVRLMRELDPPARYVAKYVRVMAWLSLDTNKTHSKISQKNSRVWQGKLSSLRSLEEISHSVLINLLCAVAGRW